MPDGNHPAGNRFPDRGNFNFDAHQLSYSMRKASAWANRTFDLTLWFGRSGAPLLDDKRFGDQARLLTFVGGERADCRTRAGIADRLGDVATEELPQPWVDDDPRAPVVRFVPTPK